MADQDIPAADLTAFLRALELAGETGLPLRAEDIRLVESAWSIPDTVVSSHGWVVALKDGQRFHARRRTGLHCPTIASFEPEAPAPLVRPAVRRGAGPQRTGRDAREWPLLRSLCAP